MENWHDIYGLKFEDGKLYFEDSPETPILLVRNIITMEGIERINLPLLGYIYSIIYNRFMETGDPSGEISLYLPDLALATIGHGDTIRNPGCLGSVGVLALATICHGDTIHGDTIDQMINTLLEDIINVDDAIGYIGDSFYAVLQCTGYNTETDILSFRSPLMEMVIEKNIL